MTAVTAPISTAGYPTAGPVRRILNVSRLTVANPVTPFVMPWIIMTAILLMNIAIWALITYSVGDDLKEDSFQWNGAIGFIFVYLMIVAIQLMNVTFPFALGYGVTRRDFYLGSAVTFVVLAVVYAAGLSVYAALERATGGWGFNGRMFTAFYFAGSEPWYVQSWVYFCLLLFFLFLGSVFAAVFVRWKAFGLTVSLILLGFLLIGLLALLTYAQLWDDFWASVGRLGWAGTASASLVITAVAGVTGFLLLRRATPKA